MNNITLDRKNTSESVERVPQTRVGKKNDRKRKALKQRAVVTQKRRLRKMEMWSFLDAAGDHLHAIDDNAFMTLTLANQGLVLTRGTDSFVWIKNLGTLIICDKSLSRAIRFLISDL